MKLGCMTCDDDDEGDIDFTTFDKREALPPELDRRKE
jgi:hypothetical protein